MRDIYGHSKDKLYFYSGSGEKYKENYNDLTKKVIPTTISNTDGVQISLTGRLEFTIVVDQEYNKSEKHLGSGNGEKMPGLTIITDGATFPGDWYRLTGEEFVDYQFSDRDYYLTNIPSNLIGLMYYKGPINAGVMELVINTTNKVFILMSSGNGTNKNNLTVTPIGVETTYPEMNTNSFDETGFVMVTSQYSPIDIPLSVPRPWSNLTPQEIRDKIYIKNFISASETTRKQTTVYIEQDTFLKIKMMNENKLAQGDKNNWQKYIENPYYAKQWDKNDAWIKENNLNSGDNETIIGGDKAIVMNLNKQNVVKIKVDDLDEFGNPYPIYGIALTSATKDIPVIQDTIPPSTSSFNKISNHRKPAQSINSGSLKGVPQVGVKVPRGDYTILWEKSAAPWPLRILDDASTDLTLYDPDTSGMGPDWYGYGWEARYGHYRAYQYQEYWIRFFVNEVDRDGDEMYNLFEQKGSVKAYTYDPRPWYRKLYGYVTRNNRPFIIRENIPGLEPLLASTYVTYGSDNDIDYELIHFKPLTFTSYNKNQVGVPQGPQKGRDQLLLGQTVQMARKYFRKQNTEDYLRTVEEYRKNYNAGGGPSTNTSFQKILPNLAPLRHEKAHVKGWTPYRVNYLMLSLIR